MGKIRTAIPQATADKLLFANRHRCCICREPRKPVQIHHLDEHPSNHAHNNLAVLCLDHHSDATGRQGLGHNYSAREILLFKENWEAQCKTWRENDDDDDSDDADDPEPLATLYKRLLLKEDQVESYRFNLEKGDEIVFSFLSDEPIDFMIMTQPQYKKWDNGEEATFAEEDLGVLSQNDSFDVPRNGWWAIVFHNPYDEPADLEYDIATWPAE